MHGRFADCDARETPREYAAVGSLGINYSPIDSPRGVAFSPRSVVPLRGVALSSLVTSGFGARPTARVQTDV